MLDLDEIKPAVTALCQRLKVTRLDLFGSTATDAFGSESNVDVLVEFDRAVGNQSERYFGLKEEFERITGRPVDVVVESAVRNPYFKMVMERTRMRIYAA
jgi:uncharacterized protein